MRAGAHPNEPKTRSVAPQEGLRRGSGIAVCHIASGDLWAGAEAQVGALLKALARKEEIRLCAIFLNEGRLAEEARRSGIEVHVIPETQKNFIQIYAQASQHLRRKGIRILHSHRYKENLLAALLAWRCRIPFVVRTQHGLSEPFGGFKRYKQALVQGVDQLVARYATDRVISVSAEQRDHLARYVDPRKIITILNGVDVEQVGSRYSPAEAKERLGVPHDCWLIGTAGRLEPIKRLDIFLSAAKSVATQFPNTRFAIAGEGSEALRLRELARAALLQDRVLFLGHRNDIYDVLRAFDIFVLCSDHEGLPMTLLEALWLGVAVVARGVGGISEALQDGVNGILVGSGNPLALAEACVRLLSDEALRGRLSEAAGKSIVEGFSMAGTAARVAELYQSLIR